MCNFDRFYQFSVVLCTLALFGCNNGSGQVPPNASIEISPASRTWTITENLDEEGECHFNENHYQDELMTVRVLDAEQRPIGDVEIMVSVALTGNTYSGDQWIKLYEDKDGDFTPDEDEFVSEFGDSLLFTRTGKYNGEKTLIVRVNLSCAYGTVFQVVAEGVQAEVEIDVVARE